MSRSRHVDPSDTLMIAPPDAKTHTAIVVMLSAAKHPLMIAPRIVLLRGPFTSFRVTTILKLLGGANAQCRAALTPALSCSGEVALTPEMTQGDDNSKTAWWCKRAVPCCPHPSPLPCSGEVALTPEMTQGDDNSITGCGATIHAVLPLP
jgi:hypothetical protein